jgi:hypothetical protein
VAATPFWVPKISMTFNSIDEAWNFWVTYGGRIGFDVRKCYTNKSGLDGLVTTCRFVQIKVLGLKIRSSQFASEIGHIQEQDAWFVWTLLYKEEMRLTKYMIYLLTITTFFRLHKQVI